jgi:hypothetical protein
MNPVKPPTAKLSKPVSTSSVGVTESKSDGGSQDDDLQWQTEWVNRNLTDNTAATGPNEELFTQQFLSLFNGKHHIAGNDEAWKYASKYLSRMGRRGAALCFAFYWHPTKFLVSGVTASGKRDSNAPLDADFFNLLPQLTAAQMAQAQSEPNAGNIRSYSMRDEKIRKVNKAAVIRIVMGLMEKMGEASPQHKCFFIREGWTRLGGMSPTDLLAEPNQVTLKGLQSRTDSNGVSNVSKSAEAATIFTHHLRVVATGSAEWREWNI